MRQDIFQGLTPWIITQPDHIPYMNIMFFCPAAIGAVLGILKVKPSENSAQRWQIFCSQSWTSVGSFFSNQKVSVSESAHAQDIQMHAPQYQIC